MHVDTIALKAAALRDARAAAPLEMPSLSVLLAATALLAGAGGLLWEPIRPVAGLPMRLEIPVLFGLLLSLGSVDEFRRRRLEHRGAAQARHVVDAVARRLAHRAFLILYLLMGLQLIRGWFDHVLSGAGFDLGSVELVQPYLAGGIANLVLIRVCAAKRRRQAAEAVGPPAISA